MRARLKGKHFVSSEFATSAVNPTASMYTSVSRRVAREEFSDEARRLQFRRCGSRLDVVARRRLADQLGPDNDLVSRPN